ncbi:MAG TPA: hypothetical protein VFU43_03110 [Streptosporangiaceae bacterium]|nr:hypothetical protein [Streptosporangiaceae bacterium]
MRIREAAAVIVFGSAASVALPALSFPARNAHAAADVRLVTTIATTARKVFGTKELIDFTVTVRALGGSARGVAVDAGIGPDGVWVAAPDNCVVHGRGERLRCELGDVSGQAELDLVARVRHPLGASAPPTLVTVTTTSSAATGSISASPSVPVTTSPTDVPRSRRPKAPAAAPRPSASPPRPAPRRPAAHRPPAPRPSRRADPNWEARRPPAAPPPVPEVPAPAAPPAVPPGGVPPGPPAPGAEPTTLGAPPSPSPPSVAPDASPDLSLVLPNVDGGSPPAAELQASKDPTAIDPAQLSIVRADPVAGSRRAWVTVLGITIVFEVAVLWLAACLSLWRRRTTLAQAASTGLTAWVRASGRRARHVSAHLRRS